MHVFRSCHLRHWPFSRFLDPIFFAVLLPRFLFESSASLLSNMHNHARSMVSGFLNH